MLATVPFTAVAMSQGAPMPHGAELDPVGEA
jgi:hypothetical protein